ncbi:MAG: YggT family protein [Chloroflexi bacterium]|nr:YggT family protein [Chloroflexota bacterium]
MSLLFDVLANFVEIFGKVMTIAIFVRALLSWFPIGGENPLSVFLVQITDPILLPLRKIIPAVMMFDLTPMIAMLLLQVLTPQLAMMLKSLG